METYEPVGYDAHESQTCKTCIYFVGECTVPPLSPNVTENSPACEFWMPVIKFEYVKSNRMYSGYHENVYRVIGIKDDELDSLRLVIDRFCVTEHYPFPVFPYGSFDLKNVNGEFIFTHGVDVR